jgi:hypothetical protein
MHEYMLPYVYCWKRLLPPPVACGVKGRLRQRREVHVSATPKKATKLRSLVAAARKQADATNKAGLKAEDALAPLEDREARRQAREAAR